jgi:hypothetical protein
MKRLRRKELQRLWVQMRLGCAEAPTRRCGGSEAQRGRSTRLRTPGETILADMALFWNIIYIIGSNRYEI